MTLSPRIEVNLEEYLKLTIEERYRAILIRVDGFTIKDRTGSATMVDYSLGRVLDQIRRGEYSVKDTYEVDLNEEIFKREEK